MQQEEKGDGGEHQVPREDRVWPKPASHLPGQLQRRGESWRQAEREGPRREVGALCSELVNWMCGHL